jgi:glycosyltransferase involved in cell wall biosynthesis
MKIGLYAVDVPATLGGGYVARDDVTRAALEAKGRHQFEWVPAVSTNAPPRSTLRRMVGRLTGRRRSRGESDALARLGAQLRERGIQLMWFNHIEPVDVGLPYILNIFDLQHRLDPWFPEVSANGQWAHREAAWADAARGASMVTVGSQEAKEQLSMFYGVPLKNIYVVPFATPSAAIAAASAPPVRDNDAVRQKYGIVGEFLFYPAQFWAHKNHVNLLHALKWLHVQHGLKLSLVFTGSDHGNQAFVETVARELGLSSFVHFLGFVPHDDVLALYRSALALSYVSFQGPENLPPLEALALGCPVVLSDIPGVRALYGETPVLVNPRSETSIAEGIKWIHDNPNARRERAISGRAMAINNSAEQYIRNIERIVDDFEAVRRCWP